MKESSVMNENTRMYELKSSTAALISGGATTRQKRKLRKKKMETNIRWRTRDMINTLSSFPRSHHSFSYIFRSLTIKPIFVISALPP